MSEKDVSVAGVSYIHTFAQNVYLLTQQSASYRHFILKLEKENKDGEITKEKQQQLDKVIEILRHTLYLTYIQYKAISKSVEQIKENEELINTYEVLEKKYIIDRKDLDNYVLLLNTELMAEALKDILNTSQNMHEKLYDETNKG